MLLKHEDRLEGGRPIVGNLPGHLPVVSCAPIGFLAHDKSSSDGPGRSADSSVSVTAFALANTALSYLMGTKKRAYAGLSHYIVHSVLVSR